VTSATRNWSDANGNYVADCNLQDFNANGECAAIDNRNFGSAIPADTFDDLLRRGYNHRESNWEFSAGMQHAIAPRVSVDVGYFRRVWQNFRVTDNLNVAAGDYDVFSMVVPSDPRLPDGGGYTLDGLVALKQSAFGRPTNNFNTLDRTFGSQTEHWNGVDVNVDARLQNGLTIQFGTSTGRTSENDCDILTVLPESQNLNLGGVTALRPSGFCERNTPWLTQFKGYAVYTLPKVDVQVSGTLRSVPGSVMRAQFNASNAYLAANSTLGRPLAGGAPNIAIDILEPNAVFLDRRNELDFRFGKVLRFGRARTVVSLDMFNATNSNATITANQNFGAVNAADPSEFRPTQFAGGARGPAPHVSIALPDACPQVAGHGAGSPPPPFVYDSETFVRSSGRVAQRHRVCSYGHSGSGGCEHRRSGGDDELPPVIFRDLAG
jgi:hypothetical protein